MKIPHLLAFLLLGASSASATVTLQFGSTSIYATNWANGSGTGGANMVWGIIIDTARDGFDFNSSGYFFNLSITAGGQSLKDGQGAASDDFMVISPALMTNVPNTNDGATLGQNRITALASVPYGESGIDVGDSFVIVWFDRTALGGGQTGYGERFGIFSNPSLTIPADAQTFSYASAFTGPDALKPMSFGFIPEPSSALLGLLGATGLLRRRRK